MFNNKVLSDYTFRCSFSHGQQVSQVLSSTISGLRWGLIYPALLEDESSHCVSLFFHSVLLFGLFFGFTRTWVQRREEESEVSLTCMLRYLRSVKNTGVRTYLDVRARVYVRGDTCFWEIRFRERIGSSDLVSREAMAVLRDAFFHRRIDLIKTCVCTGRIFCCEFVQQIMMSALSPFHQRASDNIASTERRTMQSRSAARRSSKGVHVDRRYRIHGYKRSPELGSQ